MAKRTNKLVYHTKEKERAHVRYSTKTKTKKKKEKKPKKRKNISLSMPKINTPLDNLENYQKILVLFYFIAIMSFIMLVMYFQTK